MNEPAFSALEPPTTRPRGTGTVSPGASSPVRSQLAGWPGPAARIVAASVSSGGKPAGWSAPASRSSTRRPAPASPAARTQPEGPAPTTRTSHSSAIEADRRGEVEAAHLSRRGAREVPHAVDRLGPLRRAEPFPGPRLQVRWFRRPDVGREDALAPLLVRDPE